MAFTYMQPLVLNFLFKSVYANHHHATYPWEVEDMVTTQYNHCSKWVGLWVNLARFISRRSFELWVV